MSIWRVGATVAIACVMVATTAAQSKFTLKVHTGRGQVGYDVNSTMIIGERDILLIDPQFSLSEAHKLAAEILETKKRLATIYSTHAHPDHLFGLAVLKQAFPEAKIVALPATVNAAKTGWPARQKFWVADLRQQHPRAGARAAGGTRDAGARRSRASSSRSPAACRVPTVRATASSGYRRSRP